VKKLPNDFHLVNFKRLVGHYLLYSVIYEMTEWVTWISGNLYGRTNLMTIEFEYYTSIPFRVF